MYSIEQFRELNKPERIVITQHGRRRLSERLLSIDDICNAIDNGEIIEDYPEDYPFPSCLILGNTGGRNIHLVASIDEDVIYLITAYVPDPAKWESDMRTRKEEKI